MDNDQIEQTVPQARQSIFASMQNVRSSHLLDLDLLARLDSDQDSVDEPDDILSLVTNRPASRDMSALDD